MRAMMIVGILAFGLSHAAQAAAAEPVSVTIEKGARDLEALSLPAGVPWSDPDSTGAPTVMIRGQLSKASSWTLLVGSEPGARNPVTLDPDGKFAVRFRMSAAKTRVYFTGVDPFGVIFTRVIALSAPDYPLHAREAKALQGRRFQLMPSLGYTHVSYSQTGIALTEHAVTAKVSFSYFLLPPRWDLGISGYVTVLPLSPVPAGLSARFLGINARLGYKVPLVHEPWGLSLLGGYYYTTMFANGAPFGFQNQGALQFFPALRRSFPNGQSLGLYFKFAPILDGIRVLGLSNRELATGVSWARPLENGHAVSIALDLADLKLNFNGIPVRSTTASVGFGYGL